MTKYLITMSFLLIFSIAAISQTETEPANEVPFIEVTGTAEWEIIPDEIYINISLKERIEGKEKLTISKQKTDLKNAIASLGLSLDKLTLSDANANFVRVKFAKKDVIAKSEYVLEVNDARMVGKVFEKLDELNIQEAEVSRVDHSKMDSLRQEIRIKAIKAAKEKADYLLRAIDEKTGKALAVREDKATTFTNTNNYRHNTSSDLYSVNRWGEVDKVIQFQKIKLKSSIYVKFAIQ